MNCSTAGFPVHHQLPEFTQTRRGAWSAIVHGVAKSRTHLSDEAHTYTCEIITTVKRVQIQSGQYTHPWAQNSLSVIPPSHTPPPPSPGNHGSAFCPPIRTSIKHILHAMRETWARSLSWEDPLEKGKATHSSILAWRIPWSVQSMGLQRVRHNWATFTSFSSGRFSLLHFPSVC